MESTGKRIIARRVLPLSLGVLAVAAVLLFIANPWQKKTSPRPKSYPMGPTYQYAVLSLDETMDLSNLIVRGRYQDTEQFEKYQEHIFEVFSMMLD